MPWPLCYSHGCLQLSRSHYRSPYPVFIITFVFTPVESLQGSSGLPTDIKLPPHLPFRINRKIQESLECMESIAVIKANFLRRAPITPSLAVVDKKPGCIRLPASSTAYHQTNKIAASYELIKRAPLPPTRAMALSPSSEVMRLPLVRRVCWTAIDNG